MSNYFQFMIVEEISFTILMIAILAAAVFIAYIQKDK